MRRPEEDGVVPSGVRRLHRAAARRRQAALRPGAAVVIAVSLLGSALWTCGGCPAVEGADGDGEDGACTYASCDDACRARGCRYGSCGGGRCTCDCGRDADATGEADADARADAADAADDGGADAGDADLGECPYRSTGETRAGASPGVVCRRVSVPRVETGLLAFSGDGDRIMMCGGNRTEPGQGVWEHRRSTGCVRLIQGGVRPSGEPANVLSASVQGTRAAYSIIWHLEETDHCEVRLRRLDTGEEVLVDQSDSVPWGGGYGGRMDSVVLEYPWVVWRDIREFPLAGPPGMRYQWDAVAMNAETREQIDLSVDPETGERRWDSIYTIRLKDGLAVFNAGWVVGLDLFEEVVAVDLRTGRRRQLTNDPGAQWWPAVTADWVVWLDQRAHPDESPPGYLSTDIYGWNRRTGEEQALVVAGDSMQGPSVEAGGPWVVYDDQRDGPDPISDRDREQEIYALHLPTMTEIRLTDWPGREIAPQAYDRGDGTWGVLFIEEVSYDWVEYWLWDCDLPEPG